MTSAISKDATTLWTVNRRSHMGLNSCWHFNLTCGMLTVGYLVYLSAHFSKNYAYPRTILGWLKQTRHKEIPIWWLEAVLCFSDRNTFLTSTCCSYKSIVRVPSNINLDTWFSGIYPLLTWQLTWQFTIFDGPSKPGQELVVAIVDRLASQGIIPILYGLAESYRWGSFSIPNWLAKNCHRGTYTILCR
jgi:hypothetical protein